MAQKNQCNFLTSSQKLNNTKMSALSSLSVSLLKKENLYFSVSISLSLSLSQNLSLRTQNFFFFFPFLLCLEILSVHFSGEKNFINFSWLAMAAILISEEQFGNPLLPKSANKTAGQKAIRKTLKGTARLANLLPTGSVLAFSILSPILTHSGNCHSSVNQRMALGFIGFCSLSCFFLCFTDSIRDERGKVRYVLATLNGLWVIDGSTGFDISKEDKEKYKVKFIDFFHGIASVFAFGAVALFDQNVVKCFYPTPSDDTKEFLNQFPILVGAICTVLFLVFPSTRHGIGFPLSRN